MSSIYVDMLNPWTSDIVEFNIQFENKEYITIYSKWTNHQELALTLGDFLNKLGITLENCKQALGEV